MSENAVQWFLTTMSVCLFFWGRSESYKTGYRDGRNASRKKERERDEARAALRELWISADAFLPNFDAETIARWRKAAGWEGEE